MTLNPMRWLIFLRDMLRAWKKLQGQPKEVRKRLRGIDKELRRHDRLQSRVKRQKRPGVK